MIEDKKKITVDVYRQCLLDLCDNV